MTIKLYESDDIKLWIEYLSKYKKTINLIAKKKKNEELIKLDKWLWKDLKNDVYNRYNKNKLEGLYLTKKELSCIMKWKLMRGKNRPIQKLIDSNDDNFVKLCTQNALTLLNNSGKKAIKELTKLKGVGIATASIILSVFCPKTYPFMSDEVIKSVYNGKIGYTNKIYETIQKNLLEKMNKINNNNQTGITVEMLGKALWVASVCNE